MQYNELQEKYKQTQSLASSLHTQLAQAQTEAEEWKAEVEKIRTELEDQIKVLKNALENSENERKICEDKWQREFEMLRTHNMGKYSYVPLHLLHLTEVFRLMFFLFMNRS